MLNGNITSAPGPIGEVRSLGKAPSLDAIGRNAALAVNLPPALLKTLLLRNAAAQSALTAALAASETEAPPPQPKPDRMLTVDEAAARLHRSRTWFYRHAKLPFMRRISRKALLVSENDLNDWLKRRRGWSILYRNGII